MVDLDITMENRIQMALTVISRFTHVVCAYLFGSQVDGTPDQWSDIDLAVFVEGMESWELHERATVAALVQKEVGDDVDVRFFPSQALTHHDPAGFAAWVITHGIKVIEIPEKGNSYEYHRNQENEPNRTPASHGGALELASRGRMRNGVSGMASGHPRREKKADRNRKG
ncbi:MAG: nucleotidyltransferase domain-containing protein [Candidatus Omnitrophota bacterium]|jgi:predicted nucleotidyltransferase|nr:MAG: nucleotidyltransferase domain-containing protein [Candidatus Omnitrophota bacterium]